MINPVYNISQNLIELFQSDPLVNTIAFETIDRLDVNKQNIYPLVNMEHIDSVVTETVTTVSFLITILQQREIGNHLIDNKIFGTNYIDNVSECHLIGSRVIKSFITNQEIFQDNVPTMNFINDAFENGLDGVQFNLILSVTNEEDCE